MSKKSRRTPCNVRCEACENLIAIGEGDFICCECNDSCITPISDYMPTADYLKCGGKKYE